MTRTLIPFGLLASLFLTVGCGDKDPVDDTSTDDTSTDDTSNEVDSETDCTDGIDNDNDGATDCDDDECASATECQPEADCGDGVDNDSDGAIDCADSDCADATECQGESDCGNGLDDDGDGLADCNDSDCLDPSDFDPFDEACTCLDGLMFSDSGDNLSSEVNAGAGDEFGGDQPDCGASGGEDLAVAWTPPSDGCWTIDTNGSDFDTVLRLYPACGADELLCDDDGGLSTQSSFTLKASPAEGYVIVIDGYSGNDNGTYQLNINSVPDAAASVDTDLGSATGEVATGSNAGQASEVDFGDCDGGAEVVFQFTAPSAGTWVFDTFGSDFDTVLAALGECDVRSCNDDGGVDDADRLQSLVTLNLEESETIFLAVGGFQGLEGNYVLNVTQSN